MKTKKNMSANPQAASINEVISGERRYHTDNLKAYETQVNSMGPFELYAECRRLNIGFNTCQGRDLIANELVRQFSLYARTKAAKSRQHVSPEIALILSQGR